MKKIFLIAVLMLVGLCGNAQNDMFFKWSDVDNDLYRTNTYDNVEFGLPTAHGLNNDNGAEAPLGSGLLILGVLGAGYAMKKKEVR